MSPILDFTNLFRLRDLVDVAVIAFLLYTLIMWARRLRISRIVSGLGTLALIYIIATLFDLQLTVWVFQGLFAVMAIILIVIFQAELRLLFERLAAWTFTGQRRDAGGWQSTEPLVAALSKLASLKIGALVVIPGRDTVESQVAGGIPLGASISSPLIESLFDPHSPGHDGALLVNGNRLSHFAVHLPLSTDFTQLRDRGTRHAAALGLSERTDALCIVVSEERGRISVSHEGKIEELDGAPELTARIESFVSEHAAEQPMERRKRILTLHRHWPEKAASLIFALIAWAAFVPDFGIEERTITVAIQVENLSPDQQVAVLEPALVSIALRGTGESLDRLDPELVSVILDAPPAGTDETMMRIESGNIQLPNGLAVIRVDPDVVRLELVRAPEEP